MSTKIQKLKIVGLKELRANMEEYITRVNQGESITVFRRSTPIFTISPVEDTDEWESVIDFTEINEAGVSAREVLAKLNKLHG